MIDLMRHSLYGGGKRRYRKRGDVFVTRVEHWKKRVIVLFALLSLILAVVQSLTIEGVTAIAALREIASQHQPRINRQERLNGPSAPLGLRPEAQQP